MVMSMLQTPEIIELKSLLQMEHISKHMAHLAGLKSPIGIAVDKSGNIYVADDGNNQIVEFDSNGNTIAWGNAGTGPDFFMEPRDVTVDSVGNVFVVDSDNNRIQKFGSSTPPPQIPSQTNQTSQTTKHKVLRLHRIKTQHKVLRLHRIKTQYKVQIHH